MNVKKAIEIKARTGEEFLNTDPDDIDEADRLSVEALKRAVACRPPLGRDDHSLLPGETED